MRSGLHICMDFTCIWSHSQVVRAVFFDWHSVGDSAAVLCVVLQESLLVPPPLARGKKWSQLLWLLGLHEVVGCWCLLCGLWGSYPSFFGGGSV